jgi:hypothetical protein
MSNQKEKIFADGFRFEQREGRPEFVVGRLSLKVDEAITFMKSYEKGGWVNLNILIGRSGNPYVELDTYEPKQKENSTQPTATQSKAQPTPPTQEDDDIPF